MKREESSCLPGLSLWPMYVAIASWAKSGISWEYINAGSIHVSCQSIRPVITVGSSGET